MSFIVNSTVFLKELQKIAGVISPARTLPVLEHFLLELNGDTLKITGTDTDNAMYATLEVEGKEKSQFCVPSKLLIENIKSLTNQPLRFTYQDEEKILEITTDVGKYKLPCVEADQFPRISPLKGSEKYIEINSLALASAIEKTIFATGNDELRPAMSGVFFQLEENAATFVATDAHKLIKYVRKDVKNASPVSFIMPKKPLNILKNTLSLVDTVVKIYYNRTNAMFVFDNTTFICRLIEGNFPNYEAVIPKHNPNKLLIDRRLFLESIRRVSLFSNKATYQVRFQMRRNKIVISAEDRDFNYEAKEELSCQYEGNNMVIGFNARFLIEMLNVLESETVVLSMSEPNKAGVLTPGETTDENEEMLMLVMPIMVPVHVSPEGEEE